MFLLVSLCDFEQLMWFTVHFFQYLPNLSRSPIPSILRRLPINCERTVLLCFTHFHLFFLLFFFLSFLFFLVKHHHVPGRSINRLLLCFWSSSKFLCSLSGVFRICWLTCSRAKADHFSIWSRWNTDLTFQKIMECIDVQICCKMRSQPFFSRTRLHIPYMHIYPLWDGRQKSVASTTHHRDRPNSTKSPRCQVDRVLERSEVLRGPLVSGTRCVFFGRGAFLLTLEDFMLHECRGLLDDLNPLAELHVVL